MISEKKSISSGSGIDGSYFAMNTSGQSGRIDLSTNAAKTAVTAKTASSSTTATFNSPWAGFAKTTTGYGLMAGNGVYVYMDRNVSNYYYEIGIQK